MRLLLGFAAALGALASAAHAVDVVRDCAECPEMVIVPAGSFLIGSTEVETRRENMHLDGETAAGPADGGQGRITVTRSEVAARERPQTRIAIARPFAVGRYEVTVAQYAAFSAASGHTSIGECRVYDASGTEFETKIGTTWRSPGFDQTDDSPVVCVSWRDATAYAAWLTARTGHVYRLPSEAEWEYAARAGTTTARYWGDGVDEACRFANVGDLDLADATGWRNREFTCRDGYVYTAPVGRFAPNAWGLYDVLGNAWEWIDDCWHETHAGRPTDASIWRGGTCDRLRMNKGASWSHYPWGMRSAVRNRAGIDAGYNTTGIRLVREVE
ncbi:MAG: formylglycine-generating enzyme family protein [Rhodospirillaceae bacterium]|nr:formylglycine-generating enzyme family protein [Rhodospirillaceae bacterium]